VEVALTFSTSLENTNNCDLASNVSYNYSQINENSARASAPLEYKSDAWYAEIASIKADLAALIKGKSELKELIAPTHECENKNASDLSNNSVIMVIEPNSVHSEFVTTKESSLALEEHIIQKETTMLDFLKPELSYI
jgi:hypothetical protein